MCTPKFYAKRVLMLPCLTRTRGLTGGFWVSTRGRLTTIAALFSFQCLNRKMIRDSAIGIVARQMGGILGKHQVAPSVRARAPAVGILAGLVSELLQDRWRGARGLGARALGLFLCSASVF